MSNVKFVKKIENKQAATSGTTLAISSGVALGATASTIVSALIPVLGALAVPLIGSAIGGAIAYFVHDKIKQDSEQTNSK